MKQLYPHEKREDNSKKKQIFFNSFHFIEMVKDRFLGMLGSNLLVYAISASQEVLARFLLAVLFTSILTVCSDSGYCNYQISSPDKVDLAKVIKLFEVICSFCG